jgi:hypothetical protein
LIVGVLWQREVAPHAPILHRSDSRQSEDNRVKYIMWEMEKDVTLMEDNPLSEQLRM